MDPIIIIALSLFAVVVGILIGSVGIGGVLLVPFLTYVTGLNIHTAIAAAMFGYLFAGIVGAIFYARHGSIEWSMASWLLAGAMPGALIGALGAIYTPGEGLEFVIAVLVFIAGINALRRRKIKVDPRKISNPFLLFGLGVIIGVGSAMTGTGGPLFTVPIMVSLKVPAHTAVGLSQAVQAPMASLATVGNFWYGHVDIVTSAILSAGLVIGVAAGAKIAHVFSPSIMSSIVAWILIAVGIFLIIRLAMSL